MTVATSTLAHLAEALRSHRQHVGAGCVPGALITLEAELLAALSGTEPRSSDVSPIVGQGDVVLVTTAAAASMLSLSERKVRGLRESGRLRAVVVDRAVRFKVSDVIAFANNHKET